VDRERVFIGELFGLEQGFGNEGWQIPATHIYRRLWWE
jgi:hypothetical protein